MEKVEKAGIIIVTVAIAIMLSYFGILSLVIKRCNVNPDKIWIEGSCKDISINAENVISLCQNLRKEIDFNGDETRTYPELESYINILNLQYSQINYTLVPIWYGKTELYSWTGYDTEHVTCRIPSELCGENYCYNIMLKAKINYDDWRRWFYGK